MFKLHQHEYLHQLLNEKEIEDLNIKIQSEFEKQEVTNHFARGPVKMLYQPVSAEDTTERIRQFLENHLNVELNTTFWYCTQYYNNAFMLVHRDRPACEISVSMNISSDILWDLCIQGKDDKVYRYQTPPGSAVLYSGSELLHWRTNYQGKCYTQIFFNYVRKNGSFEKFSFDPPQKLVPW